MYTYTNSKPKAVQPITDITQAQFPRQLLTVFTNTRLYPKLHAHATTPCHFQI